MCDSEVNLFWQGNSTLGVKEVPVSKRAGFPVGGVASP
jgi:hypothetical protein